MPDRDRRRDTQGPARRRFVARALSGVAAWLTQLPASAATIVAVRVWPSRDYTRVTLELDAPLQSSHTVVSDPPRVVVDLEGIDLDATLRELVAKVQPDDPYIRQVRVGQFKPRVVRVVFDLKSEVAPQLFPLAPIANYRHRLVLDLHPVVEVDPLQSLLAERQTREDPLAPLLGSRAPSPATAPTPTPTAPPAVRPPQAASAPQPVPQAVPSPPVASPPTIATGPQIVPAPALGAPAAPARPPAGDPAAPRSRRPVVRRLVTIALDPGHGGEDPGAIGREGTREKDVVLAIGRLLRERISAEPNMRAFMTRDADFFVPLANRVAKARQVQADLFVSIHADAFVNPQARGASVYVLSETRASSGAARWLANRENGADLIGGVNLGGRDREVAKVLFELSTTAQIRDSNNLGRIVLGQLGTVGALHKPQVEQAGFAVLKAPDIPSILVETAFISNPEEERRLSDHAYRAKIADAIFTGLRHYLIKYPPPARSQPV